LLKSCRVAHPPRPGDDFVNPIKETCLDPQTHANRHCSPRILEGSSYAVEEYLEGSERQRPQGIVFGSVLRRGSDAGGQPALHALVEPLDVVAVGVGRRHVARTDAAGPFQIVLPPGSFELSVERQGQPVSSRQGVRVEVDAEQRPTLIASC
jgi:hypothetical protein